MLATVPVGAIQEISLLSNAFSAEFGWTAGPALNIVTKSGTNALHGEGLYLAPSRRLQAKTFGTDRFCAPSVGVLHDADHAERDQPGRRARRAASGLRLGGRAARQGPHVLLRERRLHASGSDDLPVADAARVPAAGGRQPGVRRQLPSEAASTARVDHKLTPSQTLMVRTNVDRFFDTNPNDAVVGTNAPSVARRSTTWLVDRAGQPHRGAGPEPAQRGARRVSQRRPGHALGSAGTLDRPTRGPVRCRSRSVSRAWSDLLSHQAQFVGHAVLVEGAHTTSVSAAASTHHTSGGNGGEPGTAIARHLHLPQHHHRAVRSADAGRRAAVHPADQLRHHRATS